jgi:DNA-binding GntR family transcriptional regulator
MTIDVPQPKRSRVYDALKRQIVEMELEPGTPLSEVELSKRLGSSRTPVRESLHQLSREGLVRLVPGRGAFVAEISMRDIVELFQMREALETHAARLAAQASNRAVLVELAEEMRGAHALIEAADYRAYYDLTERIDKAIVALAGNARLRGALSELWDQIKRARHIAQAKPERLGETVSEHLSILAAITSGNEEQSVDVVRAHVKNSMRSLLEPSAL